MVERRYNTEDELPSDYTCPICFHIPPGNVFQCLEGHTICKKCLNNLREAERTPLCPSCRKVLVGKGRIRAKHIEKILDSLRLYCCFRSNGCQEILKSGDFQKHQDSCRYKHRSMINKLLALVLLHRFLLMAVGIACLGCVIWHYGLYPQGNKMEPGNIPNLSHAKNIYVPKDKYGNFLPMSPAEAKSTYLEIMNSEGAIKEMPMEAGAEMLVSFSGEMAGAVVHLQEMLKTDEERKIEFIKEVDLFPKEKQKGSEALMNEKERKAVGQVLNVLVNRYQEQVLEQLKLLFENGTVNPGDINAETLTKLMYLACRRNTESVVRFFIEKGVPVNTRSSKGLTPLHYAITNENKTAALEICKVLLENGADCNMRMKSDEFKFTPFELAKEYIGDEFANRLNNLYYEYNKNFCLMLPSVEDQVYFEGKLKKLKAQGPLTSEDKLKLFKDAAMSGTWDGVKYLLENVEEEEVDVNSLDFVYANRFTFMQLIFIQDNNKTRGLEKIKLLVEEKSADVHVKAPSGAGYLHFAARFGTADALEYFLSKGLEVKVEENGFPALLMSLLQNADDLEGEKIGRVLLENGLQCLSNYGGGVVFDEEPLNKFKNKVEFLYKNYKPECLL